MFINNYCISSCKATLDSPRFCKNNKKITVILFSYTLVTVVNEEVTSRKADYSGLVYFTSTSYHNIRPWCFIYRIPHWQKIALHNEYANAFQEHILKAVFVKRLLAATFERTVCWQSVGTTAQMCFVWLLIDSIPNSIKKRERGKKI